MTLGKVLTLSEPRFLICDASMGTRDDNVANAL